MTTSHPLSETDREVLESLESAIVDGGPRGSREFWASDGPAFDAARRLVACGLAIAVDTEPDYMEIAASDAGLRALDQLP